MLVEVVLHLGVELFEYVLHVVLLLIRLRVLLVLNQVVQDDLVVVVIDYHFERI